MVTAKSIIEQACRLSHAVTDLLFPPRCAVCRCPGYELCSDCQASFKLLPQPICSVCSKPLEFPGVCDTCSENPPAFISVKSVFVYQGAARQAILSFKYKGRSQLAPLLAELATSHVSLPISEALNVCAVPMHASRLAERGFNQAALLACELARIWDLPLLRPAALTRIRNTSTQVELDLKSRMENVRGAFFAQPELVNNLSILLIDDICTTSATLRACSEVLSAAGAESVYGFTLARTV
jgi:ComF family protein